MRRLLTILLFVPVLVSTETLTVHTYDSMNTQWGLGPKIKSSFEEQCRCELKFVTFTDGVAMLSRLKLDGDKTDADVFLGIDNYLAEEALLSKAFAPHRIDLSGISWALPEGQYQSEYFVPYDFGYFAFVGRAGSTAIASLDDLVNHEQVVIATEDPRSSTPGLGLALWMQYVFGSESENKWRKLKEQIAVFTPGWSEAYSLFVKGEVDLVMSYSTSPGYHLLAEGDDSYRWLEFAEGHLIQIELAAISRNSRRKALARMFVRHLLSESVQSQVAKTNWMFPVTNVPIPEAFMNLRPTRALRAEGLRESAIKSWRAAFR